MAALKRFSYLLIAILLSCRSALPFNEFEFFSDSNSTTRVRLNGLYYSFISRDCYIDWKFDYLDFYVFYGNGYYLHVSPIDSSNGKVIEPRLFSYLQKDYHGDYNENLNFWGSYSIVGDSIFMQRFYTEPFFSQLQKTKGKIVSNSSIVINKSPCKQNNNLGKELTFFPTKNKPDSINPFITNKTLIEGLEKERKRRLGFR